MEERQLRFQTECREGHADIAFVATGTNLQLNFESNAWSDKDEDRIPTREYVDFEREPGKCLCTATRIPVLCLHLVHHSA